MSFQLFVDYHKLPDALSSRWETAFAQEGFQVEIFPGFEPRSWCGGLLPIRILQAPRELMGYTLPGEGIAGFDVSVDDTSAWFRSPMGRCTAEFALQCVGAATLARVTEGKVQDPQSGREATYAQAMELARDEIRRFLGSVHLGACHHQPFPGWGALASSGLTH